MLESNSSHPEDKFLYCFGRSYDFLVVTDDQMIAYLYGFLRRQLQM